MIAQTCPCCERTWTPSAFDDCCVPFCGCFGTFEEATRDGAAPCESCGLSHALTCRDPRREPGDLVKVVEIGSPLGEVVVRPSLRIRET